jgi:lysyl-tRNA synthetase class 2
MENPHADNEFYQQRLKNLSRLQELGYDPFGGAFERTGTLREVSESFEEDRTVRIAGRLVSKREMGKSIFAHLQDGTGRQQIYAKKNALGDDPFSAFKILDIGDLIGIEGKLFTTRTGEQTVAIENWALLGKALLPLPEKWHGLQDVDTRYRQRYLDLIANEEVRETFVLRSRVIREIRKILWDRGFMEVETPMIQQMAGGAAANPFKTRYEALGTDMFLRIAPELYLKRLLVGGYDKVFELNRNFRNEGLSRSHNPEFTMLEIYEAYGDVGSMMNLVEEMITTVAERVMGTLQVGSEGQPIDLAVPWRRAPYHDLVRQKAGDDWFDLDLAAAKARATELGCQVEPDWNQVDLSQEVFEKLIERTLVQPTFVTRLPVELVPLAKRCSDDPSVVDVFELIIGGWEIAPAYTELNDPIDQRSRFEEQADGDATKLDEEFLGALAHGMPPAGGMGVGIDRLLMILTGLETIRDVILFPQLKPRDV